MSLGIILPNSHRTASVVAEDMQVHALELSKHDFFEHLGHMQDLLIDEMRNELDHGDAHRLVVALV